MFSHGHRYTHAISPATAKSLVAQFSSHPDLGEASDSSNSPDSLYSNGSPTFHDTAFEFDMSTDNLVHVEERDEDDYESIMGSADGRDVGEEDWRGDSWGRWPESGLDSQPGWTPSPKSGGGGRKASIISISPRGSLSNKGSLAGSRRPSTPGSKLKLREEERRDSNPSLLGFDLAQRRNSSRSLSVGSRRRSSVLSTGSTMDPAEDARLRNITSMELLRRRFSEVVEVTQNSDSEDELQPGHIAIARAAMMQSPWTPDYDSEDEEDSEIHTAPYVPTPDMNIPVRSHVPGLLSNYPLPSAVPESPTLGSPSDYSAQASPVVRPRPIRMRSHQLIATPPPPAQPQDILRARGRPAFPRAATDYQFPPRSMGVPVGAGPPPALARATSTPFFSAVQKAQPLAQALELRAAGTFPVARSIPIGISPLRAQTRRESVVSDGGSRRGSILPSSEPRMSLDSRRFSVASTGSRRGSIVAERRMSIVMGISVPRRMSTEPRRPSKQSVDSRRSSQPKHSVDSRRSSQTSSMNGRKGSYDPRRGSKDRQGSLASRKSSVVSIGEYGYLGPQIVIDTATPALASSSSMPQLDAVPDVPAILPFRRANAPKSIALPVFVANTATHSAPTTPSGHPRFNLMDAFLGLGPTDISTPTPTGAPLVTPYADMFTPGLGLLSPMSERSSLFETPKQNAKSIMDRPRPISPPEFLDAFPAYPRNRHQLSPKLPRGLHSPSSTDTHVESVDAHLAGPSSSETHVDDEMDLPPSPKQVGPRLGTTRKAVPQLTDAELRQIEQGDVVMTDAPGNLTRNYLRRGAVELFTPGDGAIPRPALAHRRTESVQTSVTPPRRPTPKRQTTLPPDFEAEVVLPRTSPRRDPRQQAMHQAPQHQSPRYHQQHQYHPQQQHQHQYQQHGQYQPETPPRRTPKYASVTFSPEVKDVRDLRESPVRPPMQRATSSSSSFSRFFHHRSKSSTTAQVISSPLTNSPGKGQPKAGMRPVSMEGFSSSSGSDKTLVEVRDMLRKIGHGHGHGHGSPKSPRSPRDVGESRYMRA